MMRAIASRVGPHGARTQPVDEYLVTPTIGEQRAVRRFVHRDRERELASADEDHGAGEDGPMRHEHDGHEATGDHEPAPRDRDRTGYVRATREAANLVSA